MHFFGERIAVFQTGREIDGEAAPARKAASTLRSVPTCPDMTRSRLATMREMVCRSSSSRSAPAGLKAAVLAICILSVPEIMLPYRTARRGYTTAAMEVGERMVNCGNVTRLPLVIGVAAPAL